MSVKPSSTVVSASATAVKTSIAVKNISFMFVDGGL